MCASTPSRSDDGPVGKLVNACPNLVDDLTVWEAAVEVRIGRSPVRAKLAAPFNSVCAAVRGNGDDGDRLSMLGLIVHGIFLREAGASHR